MASYRGHGPKKRGKETTSVEMKSVFTGKCTIDAILNMLRKTDFVETMTSHTLCQHTDYCMKCILRSALCKAKLGSGNKKTVQVAEITNNLELFYNEEDVTHNFEEGTSDEVEMLSLKITLDTMLSKSAFINQLQLPVLCTECHKDMNTNTNGYFILQNTNLRDIGKAFEQHISNLIECHHTRSIECETGSFKYGKLPITLMMMMGPSSLESTNAQVIIGNEIYDLKAQISYKENNFYTTCKVDTDKYFKLDGNNSKQKIHAANPKHTIVAMYRKQILTKKIIVTI